MRGINTRAQLAEAEAALQQRLRRAAMEAGVTLVAPETVFFAADTKLGRDVVDRASCGVRPGVTVEDDAVIRSFSHLDRGPCGKGRHRRPVCAAAAGAPARRGRAHRQFRRDQGVDGRGRRQGQSPELYRRHDGGRRQQHRRRHDHLQLRRRLPSIAPRSARAPSSGRTRRWWRRSRSATAPISAPVRSSPRTCRPMRWRSAAPGRRSGQGGRTVAGTQKRRARQSGFARIAKQEPPADVSLCRRS